MKTKQLVEWFKNYFKKMVETDPYIRVWFNTSKGWRWFWHGYFIFSILLLVDVLLAGLTGGSFIFRPDGTENNQSKRIVTLHDWVLICLLFFWFCSTLIYWAQINHTRQIMIRQYKGTNKPKNIFAKIFVSNKTPKYPPNENWASPLVLLLIFVYFISDLFSLLGKIFSWLPFQFLDLHWIIRVISVLIVLFGTIYLMGPPTRWLDKQKPILIYSCIGVLFFVYFLWLIRSLNYL